MSNPVNISNRGPVAVLQMDRPPVNSLGYDLRAGIADALERANADASVQIIVLTGSARAFSAGADITEFGTPNASKEPNLRVVIGLLENSPKPVVGAIAGQCLGGGLELAMGCHFRVALADAQLGLPEVKIGLLPGAGGTQRLPRLIGLEAALNMIVSGNPQAAAKFAGSPLVDRIIEGDLVDGAVAFAVDVLEKKLPARRARDLKVKHEQGEAFLQFARNTVGAMAKNFPAPLRCLEAVAASLSKPFDEGLRLEREGFLALMATPESRALRHVFGAERAAAKIPGLPQDTQARSINKVGVIGAGMMGGGITMNFLNAGIPVVLLEMKQEALDKGLGIVRRNYENSMKKGKLKPEQLEQRLGLVTPTLSYDAFTDVDLVIEAVFENMDVKRTVFEALDKVCKPGAILASNTSYLNIDRIANFTRRPADVLGLHFFSPANVMRLLELVRGAKTSKETIATSAELSRRIGKVWVLAGNCDGFIGNRMLHPYLREAEFLVEEGATPQQVDKVIYDFGFAMGPFAMQDLAGLDVGWRIRKGKAATRRKDLRYSHVGDRLCEQGRFGQKTGAGWYRYEAGSRAPKPDPEVEAVIAAAAKEGGIARRQVNDEEVLTRCLWALVNEGARILEEGIALRSSDIDVTYLYGYGFPRYRGGPMFYADQVGLKQVYSDVVAFHTRHGEPWTPAPLLERLAKEGKGFRDALT